MTLRSNLWHLLHNYLINFDHKTRIKLLNSSNYNKIFDKTQYFFRKLFGKICHLFYSNINNNKHPTLKFVLIRRIRQRKNVYERKEVKINHKHHSIIYIVNGVSVCSHSFTLTYTFYLHLYNAVAVRVHWHLFLAADNCSSCCCHLGYFI